MSTTGPSVKLPPISITATQLAPPKLRARSNSIVKVEEVGESQEEVLDQNLYANVNADWVNRKGLSLCSVFTCGSVEGFLIGKFCSDVEFSFVLLLNERCLDHPPFAHSHRQGRHRCNSRCNSRNKLDFCQPGIPSRTSYLFTLYLQRLTNHVDVIPNVPLGNRHSFPQRSARRSIRQSHSLGTNRRGCAIHPCKEVALLLPHSAVSVIS